MIFFLKLFSFTARITELMQVLKDLNQGKYERTMVSQEKGKYESYNLGHSIMFCWHMLL